MLVPGSGCRFADPLHGPSDPTHHWTTVNAAEAVPGVQTPLSASAWKSASNAAFKRAAIAMGISNENEQLNFPATQFFYGRASLSVDYLKLIGDRMPGTTGEQVVTSLVGRVPVDMSFAPTRDYYLSIARRFPVSFALVPRRLLALERRQRLWWTDACRRVDDLDEASAVRALREAVGRHREATIMQTVATFSGVQPIHDRVERVAKKFGANASVLTTPVGGPEMEVIEDIWTASRGRLSVEAVIARHGFHGPHEGEASSRVWREDPAPVRKLVEQYARRGDSYAPLIKHGERTSARAEAERQLVAAVPVAARPGITMLLHLARRRLHLRGLAKRSMLQGLDGIRASARRLGTIYASSGRLDSADDIFFLSVDELANGLPDDARAMVEFRRRRYEAYRGYDLPMSWSGEPAPLALPDHNDGAPREGHTVVTGVGVSAGIVEGHVRVVDDPAFTEVEDDEILVAPITDPSWSTIMFVSAALVVDIGGALSHAAVVARELGIPCVVGTGDGTRVLRTGDRVRVNGGEGTVEVIGRRHDYE